MRETQHQKRAGMPSPVGRNVVMWGLIGSACGLVMGTVLGFAFTTPGRFGFWMAVVGTTVFLGAVSAFTAGIASLGAPPPGEEPPDAGAPPAER